MRWYYILLVISFLGLMGSTVDDLVIGSSMVTLGLMIPVWVVLANLWWVMILVSPWVVLQVMGRGGLGICLSLALTLGGAAWFWASVVAARARVLPAPAVVAQVEGARPFGVEVSGLGMESCDILCQGLLSGGDVAWLRGADEGVIWLRVPDVECDALDPERARGPCILAEKDRGQVADLRIALVQQVPGDGLPDPQADWVGLKHLSRVEVTARDGRRFQAQSWTAEEAWPLLTPAVSMGPPDTQGKVRLLRLGIASDDPGLRGLLDRVGLKASNADGTDAVMVMTMLWATAGRWRTEAQEQLVGQWLLGLMDADRRTTSADRRALLMVRDLGIKGDQVKLIQSLHPDWVAP